MPPPGLGGHCIPIDPHYLSWKLRTLEYRARFVELSDDVNLGLLAEHPRIRTTTYAELLARPGPPAATVLPHLTAGSWVYGTLSTWIGDEAKNRGWDLLCEAKQSCDRVLASGRLDSAQVSAVNAQLAICESSDWFWWFGDYNPSAAVASFDSLYRRNLARLYRLLQLEEEKISTLHVLLAILRRPQGKAPGILATS